MSADRTREQISEEWAAASDGREVSSYLWEEVINTRRERDEAREDRDSAEATIARLQAEIAHLSRERDDAADRMTSALVRLDGAEATIARLQDDVVSLTQAGDLHRKEGDEARALIRDLAHLSPGALGSYSLWAQIHDFLEAIDREGPRVPAGRGLTELDERERSVVLALHSVCDALDVSIVGSVRLNDGPGPRNLAAAADADGTLRVWLEGPYDVRRLTAAPVEPSSAATYAPIDPRVLAEGRAKLDQLPDTVHTTRISHGIAASDVYRRCLQARPSWALILLEEVSEAVEAIGDVTALRAELVQVGAVACAWVEAIDRRQGGDRG